MTTPSLSRRDFLQLSAGSLGALDAASPAAAQSEEKSVAILLDPAFASSPPVSLAVQELGQALAGSTALSYTPVSTPNERSSRISW